MSNCAMLYKYVKRTRYSLVRFYFYFIFLYFGGVFNKTIIPLALDGFEMIIANPRSWNDLLILCHVIENT